MSTYEYFIETNDFHCKYAKGKPTVYGREFHDYDEIVMFLDGNARFVSKDTQITLQPNNVVWISREQFHQFIVSETDSYTRCIVAIKRNSLLSPLFHEIMNDTVSVCQSSPGIQSIFNNIINTATGTLSQREKAMLLGALITQLLFEEKQSTNTTIKSFSNPSSIVSRAISYIDTNLSNALTVKEIAQQLHISESTLSHKFREELNMSVYRYISKKRISVARLYICSGYSIGQAALLSGFNDYGSFFRICKSYYGIKPSELVSTNIVASR